MAAPLGRDSLPELWSYGVCGDGRVFFINDKSRSTTWLHPRSGEPVNSGHMIRSDLPRGWEEGFTDEGASYFINHNLRATSFRHPVTGQISPENTEYTLQGRTESPMSKSAANQRSPSMVAESSKTVTLATGSKNSRGTGKVHSFGKRDHAIKRNLNVPVVVRGWLYKQDSSGMRLWKRKWFVLSDYCLFYYKDSREESVLGSIPLPSYVIAAVEPDDHINRKFAFKASHTGMRSYIYNKNSVIGSQAEHYGMRTYFFSADTQEDMNGWIRAMNQAALMQQSHTVKRQLEKPKQPVPLSNHVHNQTPPPSEGHREDPTDNGVPPPLGDDPRFGLEVQGRPSRPNADGRAERRSSDSAASAPYRNGQQTVIQVTLPPEQNGNVVYQRGLASRADTEKHSQRKTTLAQVEQWVKVHKGDTPRSAPPAGRTPPLKPKAAASDVTYQSLPKSPLLPCGSSPPPAACRLPSDYKYAHDRLSHFRMSTDERLASREGTVWRLYEWQQRQRFRHGSPTATVYAPPGFTDSSSSFRVTVEMPRSVSVPPSPCEVPPSVFKPSSPPRRPHTPSDRRSVKPPDEAAPGEAPPGNSTGSGSPGHVCAQLTQTSQHERRSTPAVGYITHTVSAPSLHGKTTLNATSRPEDTSGRPLLFAASSPMICLSAAHLKADDTYTQLKKDLEYLDLKVKLSRLCEQDKILQELEATIRTLKEDKDKLDTVLDVSHQQMEHYRDQPAHAEKIAYQQRLLQEDVVHIRAEISQVSTEMENAWSDYVRLERDVDWLKSALQGQMTRGDLSQPEKLQIRKELWRIDDVLSGLSAGKDGYQFTPPERTFVPSVPSVSGSPHLSPGGHTPTLCSSPSQLLRHSATVASGFKWGEDDVPPRPPLPQLYSPDEPPPAVPPLPREASVIRHTSVRGLKRQSDERKRDREVVQGSNGDSKAEIRPFLSDPELVGDGDCSNFVGVAAAGRDGYQTLPSRGASGASLCLHQSSSISSYVTLRRGTPAGGAKERPKSALERLYSGDAEPQHHQHQRGRMSADEQLERMKRHQKALIRQRKRTLSHGDRHGDRHASPSSRAASSSSSSSSLRPLSADLGSWRREQDFDLQLLERAVQGEESQSVRSVQGEERPPEHRERPRSHSDEWLTFCSTATTPPTHEDDLEPLEYDLDLNRELSKPQKVLIPERYVDSEPEEPLSLQEVEDRHRKVERIKSILTKSSVQKLAPAPPPDRPESGGSALQEQERIITMSYTLASEASLKSKLVAAQALFGH
ncbi:pleckstrin homology domain-containing family A member 7 isoform X2 [Antennarius striatus]|uniref:pleckstrin homology domain-containing family A member 7 isoform X2 n=1 Tax=Antennarius striatus TaxID=241820 RepID=UPI0035B3C9EC